MRHDVRDAQHEAIRKLYEAVNALEWYVELARDASDELTDEEATNANRLDILKETIEDVLDEVIGD